jgi:hypothetical protein
VFIRVLFLEEYVRDLMRRNTAYTIGPLVGFLLLVIFLVMGGVACIRDEAEQATVEPEGPALVMFYTDG